MTKWIVGLIAAIMVAASRIMLCMLFVVCAGHYDRFAQKAWIDLPGARLNYNWSANGGAVILGTGNSLSNARLYCLIGYGANSERWNCAI
jgi:hypothetical protein